MDVPVFVEKLSLEIQAVNRGLTPVKPAATMGSSGVVHYFSFVAEGSGTTYCFDIYDDVTEIEVLKTYIKKFDTGHTVSLVCTTGKVSSLGIALAREYGLPILAAGEIPVFFDTQLIAARFAKFGWGSKANRN